LNDTSEFSKTVYEGDFTPTSFTIMVANKTHHKTGTTYSDIVRYNSSNNPETNDYLARPIPLLFPFSEADIRRLDLYKEFLKDLEKAVHNQTNEMLDTSAIPKVLKISET
jgi:hypothetical protein